MSSYKVFQHDFRLDGKTAVITGGASGIGHASAQMLSEKGARIVLIDLNPDVENIAKEIAPDALGLQVDISRNVEIQAAVDKILTDVGNIDILCNIAGMGSGSPADEISENEFRSVINVNLSAAFFLSQAVGKTMIEAGKGGRIINMASQAGVVALYGHVAYSASKAGLLAVTRDLALEWGKYGITCNAVSPTVVLTPMARDYWVGERGAAHLAQIPTGRFAEMDEIAAAVAFLASDAAQMINGHNLVVDGGFTIA
ncbi:D-threitol dehydrogenase [Lachnospiraceae bacterium ASD3451]|uniref:GolD/DthD family dehydrogenase n=1 Tax=Diplocloster agilis TaxID=2850323 RepID=UPI001DD9E24A|nr:D-threitol dehydrogenase [Diplocloster agilis]MBU9742245.1 D-threitol dehydrogenase [Diplocloster agilis]